MIGGTGRDRAITRALEAWFAGAGRPMPWRPGFRLARDPYHALVSEFMLQQTQVSRVLDFFPRFIDAFPDVLALARADEQRVMALWAGLGYYRRARNLHGAAKAIVADHGGAVPREVDRLRTLPGVGRYTAGAIASIVFGSREPAVDGNVTRVLLRIEGRDLDPSAKTTADWTWTRAGELVRASGEPASWNEGLMELGATVCAAPPARPRCGECPIAKWCRARALGTQDRIPRAKRTKRTSVEVVHSVVMVRGRGASLSVLMEQRGEDGLWAGMWQVPAVSELDEGAMGRAVGRTLGMSGLERVGRVDHATTARVVRFVVWRAHGAGRAGTGRQWVRVADLCALPVSNAHWKVMRLAGVERSVIRSQG